MICPCGGIAEGVDYFPVKKKVKTGMKQTTYTCNACGRRRVELRDASGKLVFEKG